MSYEGQLTAYSPAEYKRSVLARACNDLDKDEFGQCFCIANRIFKHDSSWSTNGIGKKYNNPGNKRCSREQKHNEVCIPKKTETLTWGHPTGPWAKFPTLEDGIYGNVALYVDRYKEKAKQGQLYYRNKYRYIDSIGFHPIDNITAIWAGNPHSKDYWLGMRTCADNI